MADNIEHIINGCIAGKHAAREMLYRKFSGKLWAVCVRYAKDHDEAKDILQEGFIKIFEKIAQFEGRGHFEGWMRRIMVNTALAEYRKHRFLNIETSHVLVRNAEAYENVEHNLTADELLAIIKDLPPQYKIVFNLFAIEGYSHKEIATMLNISEGTSKSNLSRARDILQHKVRAMYNMGAKTG